MSSHPRMVNPRLFVRALLFVTLLSVLSAGSASLAYGQFTVTVSSLTPQAGVDPGEVATANVTIGANAGFSGLVSLTCVVTSGPVTTGASAPACIVSPTSATPPAIPALTITTADSTPVGTYQITVTGTSGAVVQTATAYLNVADLTEDYQLSVYPTAAVPSPIPAGSTATTTVTVMPIGSYSGTVTLACLSMTPIVTASPYCSFNPATVTVGAGAGATSTITVTTFGAAAASTTSSRTKTPFSPRLFYALGLAIPGLALLGAGGPRRRNFLGVLVLLGIAGGLLLVPACNTNTLGSRALNGQVTPNNAYTLTLSGADQNGAGPSNVGTCTPPSTSNCDAAIVTLTVTTATTAD